MTMLALMLLMEEPTAARVPRFLVVFPLEGSVDVEVECRDSERERLFDDVLGDELRVEIIERAFALAEGE